MCIYDQEVDVVSLLIGLSRGMEVIGVDTLVPCPCEPSSAEKAENIQ